MFYVYLGGIDYTIVSHILRIAPSGRECIDIAIIDDEITESCEQFLVVLNSTQISRVIIEDNDGKNPIHGFQLHIQITVILFISIMFRFAANPGAGFIHCL